MAEVKANAPAKKGNKTTEIIVGAGAQKLVTAVAALRGVVEVIDQLPTKVQENLILVSDLEDKIGGLKQDLQNKTAQNKIEIEQAYQADCRSFVDKWLSANGMTSIETSDLNELKSDLEEATTKMNENVAKAVNAATSSMKKEHENEIKMKTMEFEKKEADNLATIKQNAEQIKFLNEQVGYWKKALEDEREAGVKRAQASSIGTLNVGNTPR